MQIHEVKIKDKPKKKRIGRGGKRGTYSGRGSKGQKARSGAKINPLFEGGRSSLMERLKKVGGFKSIHPKKIVITLDQLNIYFSDGETVSIESLVKKRMLRKKEVSRGVKILSKGSVSKKITIGKDILVSDSAGKAIEKAGGKISEKEPRKRKSEK